MQKISPVPFMPPLQRAHLLVLEPHENNLLHERQLGLFAPLGAFAEVPRIECNRMPIFRLLVGRFGGAVVVAALGCWRADPADLVLAISCGACTASPARQTRA